MTVYHLISGGGGFVGRNLARRLEATTDARIVVVDDCSVGLPPAQWPFDDGKYLGGAPKRTIGQMEFWGDKEQLMFWSGDFREFLRHMLADDKWLATTYKLDDYTRFTDTFHFAAIVGGRAKIDGDPMMVALDLSIDAEFFYWACRHKPDRVMFPSSSAAYPIKMQVEGGHVQLKETDIDFSPAGTIGAPDMTYGWSKLTGEYLARIAASHYGLSVACVRPFSGYGEDQDLTYPIPAIAARAARKEDPFEVWGTGNQGRDFVHIDDCIDCILFALDNIKDGSAINIGTGKLTSFNEIISLMSEFAGYKPTIKQLLDKPVGVHARVSDMSYVNDTLGWKPKVSLRDGMRRVYEQQKKNNNVE